MASQKKITLKSSDGETFEVEESVAVESQTIKHMIEDDCADNVTPLPNVTNKILAKVIEYCKKHVETPKIEDHTAEEEIKAWDAEFVKVDQATLFDLILKLKRSVVDMNTCISTNVNGVSEGQQKKVKILLHKLIISKQQS